MILLKAYAGALNCFILMILTIISTKYEKYEVIYEKKKAKSGKRPVYNFVIPALVVLPVEYFTTTLSTYSADAISATAGAVINAIMLIMLIYFRCFIFSFPLVYRFIYRHLTWYQKPRFFAPPH